MGISVNMSSINEKILSKLPGVKQMTFTDANIQSSGKPHNNVESEHLSVQSFNEYEESKIYRAMDIGGKCISKVSDNDILFKVKRYGLAFKGMVESSARATGKATSTTVKKKPSTTRSLIILTSASASSMVPIGAAAIGIYMCSKGALDVKELVVNKDKRRGFQGITDIDTGIRSGIVFMTTHKDTAGTAVTMALKSPAASSMLIGLGILHGTAEAGKGVLNIKEGLETENKNQVMVGALEVSLGVGIAVSSVFCPLPVSLALGVVAATKAGMNNRDMIEKELEDVLERFGIDDKEDANESEDEKVYLIPVEQKN
jgi:hypothetical protein